MTLRTSMKLWQMSAVALAVAAVGAITYGATADAGEVDTPWTAPAWSGSVAYNPSDMVENGGSKFWAIMAVPAGTATSNTTYWQPIVTTYFIDAAGGLDTYNGLSQYAGYITNSDGTQGTANAAYGPWQTLAAVQAKTAVGYWDTVAANTNTYPQNHPAWTAALSGSVFLFKRGTSYAGQIQVNVSSAPTSHGDFLFGAYGTGARPQINHDAMTARYSLDRGLFWVNKDNVKVRNLSFDGLYGVSDPGNTLHPKKTGIDPSGSVNFSFVNSSITRSGGDGLLIGSLSTYAYLKNSTFTYCGLGGHPGNGVGGGATGGLIENLTVSHCGVDALLTHGIYIANWDEFTVRRCDISYSANFGINSGCHGANPLIEENYIHDNLNGIDVGSSAYNTDQYYTGTLRILGNIIANNGVAAGSNGNAIYTVNFCTDALIANNLIYGNYGDGITVHRPTMTGFAQRPTSNVKIHNNTFYTTRPARCVRFLDPVTASSVRNNIMYGTHSGVDGVMQDTGMVLSELTLTNNLYYFPNKANQNHVANLLGTQTTLAAMQGSGYESGSLVGNPLFTNVGTSDFSLQAGSPAKLAGYTSGIALDLLRSARHATTPSIGAYE